MFILTVATLAFTACGEDYEEMEEAAEELATAVDEEINSQPEKVTIEEFNAIQNGMTYQQVVNIIGGEGTLAGEYSYGYGKVSTYSWEGNHWGSTVTMSFDNGILNSKMQIGLQ